MSSGLAKVIRLYHPPHDARASAQMEFCTLVEVIGSRFVRLRESQLYEAAFARDQVLLADMVDEKGDRTLIAGCVVFEFRDGGPVLFCEIGTVVSGLPGFGMQSLMMKAMALQLYIWEGVEKIIAVCARENTISINGIEKAHFVGTDADECLARHRPIGADKRLYRFCLGQACQAACSLAALEANPFVRNSKSPWECARLALDIPLIKLGVAKAFLNDRCREFMRSESGGVE